MNIQNLNNSIALYCKTAEQQTFIKNLAEQLGIPLTHTAEDFDFTLCFEDGQLILINQSDQSTTPMSVDFVAGKMRHRRLFGGGRNQPLARAVGLNKKTDIHILDATAGLGRDAFVFACLGAKVTMLERSIALFALLNDGLKRAQQDDTTMEIVKQLTLIHDNSQDYLQSINADQYPDVIYLDPMYPHRNKSALVKKEMRIARSLVGDDHDANITLDIALTRCKHRVVVKRPKHADPINNTKVSTVIESKNTRYDIYTIKAF